MIDILVVDDESPVRDWIVYSIKMAGEKYNVVGSAKSGLEAYEMIKKYKPNVVITDIKMPGMDGIELMKKAKAIQPYTIFIILTNYAEFSYAKEAISYGAKEYILKSELRSVDLIRILEEALKEMTKTLEGKKHEVLSSGYIDLYSLYQNYNNKDYIQKFWEGFGANPEKPYLVLGLFEDPKFNQRDLINNLIYNLSLANASIKNNFIYIMIQEDVNWTLERKLDIFIKTYMEKSNGIFAVGSIESKLSNYLQAVDKVESTLLARFFYYDKGKLCYDELIDIPLIDKKSVLREYADIVSKINLNNFSDLKKALEKWFDNFKFINIQDVTWARESCIKAVISLEAKLIQFNPQVEGQYTETRSFDSLKKCREISMEILDSLITANGGEKSATISEALDYIHENYNKDISLVKVANYIYRSPEYFSRLFKEELGVNFSVYLTIYRLNRAELLLRTTHMPISQIAYEVGYSSPSYFSRIFKKYVGVTPETFRYQKN